MRPFHHQRPLTAVAAAWGLGVVMGIFMPWRPLLLLCGLLLALLCCCLLRRAGRKLISGLMAVCLFAAMIEAGVLLNRPGPPEGRYRVTAVAAEDFSLRENERSGGYLQSVRLESDTAVYRESKVYWSFRPEEGMPLPREGDSLSFTARLHRPDGQMNPYGFNSRSYYLSQGVFFLLSGITEYSVDGHPGRGLASFLYQARQAAAEKLRQLYGADSALPDAMILGIREELPEDTKTAFAKAGVAHILAISGLHVSLLAEAVNALLKGLMSRRKRTALLCILLFFYCALLGFSAPAVRASLMFAIANIGRILRRPQDLLTELSFAFLLILIVWPFSILSTGFVLSFCAALGMALWKRPLEERLSRLPIPSLVRRTAALSFSVGLGILIPSIVFFHRFSLLGLLLSPLVCAVFSVLLPLYTLTLALGFLSLPLGQMVAVPAVFATRAVVAVLKACAKWPFAQITLPMPPICSLAGLILALLALCSFCALSKRRKRALAICAAVLSLSYWGLTENRDVRYIQFAMGQADAAIIMDGKETLLLDTGEYGGDLCHYLLAAGRKADRVVITHLHADHCMGLKSLMDEEVPIGEIYLPEGSLDLAADERCLEIIALAQEKGIPVSFLHAGDELCMPRSCLTVLWPQAGKIHPDGDPNAYSLSALIDLDGVKALFAGDLTGTYERYAQADADVLKVAHHGSRESTQAAYLAAVSPSAAIITANAFGNLPSADTLSRLADQGIMVYNTGETGALTLTAQAGQARITPYLTKEPDRTP